MHMLCSAFIGRLSISPGPHLLHRPDESRRAMPTLRHRCGIFARDGATGGGATTPPVGRCEELSASRRRSRRSRCCYRTRVRICMGSALQAGQATTQRLEQEVHHTM